MSGLTIHGAHALPDHDYFLQRVAVAEPAECWRWLLQLDRYGYGYVQFRTRRFKAHRMSYLLFRGPIPDGLTVDHMCFNRACVNPNHLRLLTPSENSRARRELTHCARGHEYTEENTYTYVTKAEGWPKRSCRECSRAANRRWYARENTK